MGSVLVVNAGSTSLKLSAVDEAERSRPLTSLGEAPSDVIAVGHRVVHGGPSFCTPVLLDERTLAELHALVDLAPLHNAPALAAIEEARRTLPGLPQVAVFDTEFHATMPDEASTYAVPERWRTHWHVRRYGFHGLSVQWASEQVRVARLVVCHLGGGCSVTAVHEGRSVDTSMGFSPLEGVPMETRSGSIDPGALLYVLREHGLSAEEVDRALEHESGLAAFGGLDDPLGFAVYTYRISGTVAQMAAALGGLDALAFSGGVGENRADVRDAIGERVRFLGDFTVEVVPAREDLVIAAGVRDLFEL